MTHSHHPGISVQTMVSPIPHGLQTPACPPGHEALRVLDLAARDALSVCYRYEGLWVEVLTERKFYRLIGGLTNDCWVSCGHGGGDGDISPDDLPIASKTQKGIVQIGDNISVDAEGLIAVPAASDDTAGVVELASAEETKAGTDNSKAVTPARLAEALVQDKVDNPLPVASKTQKGIVQIGDNINVDADGLIAIPVASDDTAGVVELASAEETKAGTDNSKAVTPAGLADALVQDKVDYPVQSALEYIKDSVHFYVRSDGNDENTGLEDSPSGAWRTVQRAVEARRSYLTAADCNFGPLPAVHVHVGAGIFPPIRVEHILTDAETFIIEGMGEDSTIIEGVNRTAVALSNGGLKLKNIMLHTVLDKNSAGTVVSAAFSSFKLENVTVKLTDNRLSGAFGTVGLIWCTVSAVNVSGLLKLFPITPHANAGLQGFRIGYNCFLSLENNLEIVGTPTLGYTVVGYNSSIIILQPSLTISGSSIGRKYSLTTNSIIDSSGKGAAVLPGSIDGITSKGGVYY